MSGLGWKLRRLRAMTPAEAIQRARVSVRDRLAPPAWSIWTPEEAGVLLFNDGPGAALPRNIWSRVAQLPPMAACRGTLDAAGRLSHGRWTRFGREIVLNDPPRWNLEPVSGALWPNQPSRQIDHRRTDLPGGAKAVWEAGRLTMLPTLALAARFGGGRDHAGRARRWLSDFVTHHPLGHGIHHTSGIEMAIRTMTMAWTLALLDADESPGKPADAGGAGRADAGETQAEAAESGAAAGFIAQQALWCREHLSLGSSANNHLLAEYASMVVAGAGLPSLRGADHLLEEGLAGIVHELPLQIHEDGVTAEQAFRYLPFVWELLLPALTLAEAAGRKIHPSARGRLARSLDFARALRRADGTLPPVGDEDDARILMADETGTRLDLAGNALAAWLGEPGLAEGFQGLAHLLTGRAAPASRIAPDGERAFASGGCTVWRSGPAFSTFDHGPLGLGSLAAHGHADALSVTLR
ncbi:MAG: heparinase II/III family protein, partial [Candidatus Eisenbacteria bacterium]